MKLPVYLLILALSHLAGPGLAECPLDTEMVVVELEKEVKALKVVNFHLKKGIIDFGLKVDAEGRIWR